MYGEKATNASPQVNGSYSVVYCAQSAHVCMSTSYWLAFKCNMQDIGTVVTQSQRLQAQGLYTTTRHEASEVSQQLVCCSM